MMIEGPAEEEFPAGAFRVIPPAVCACCAPATRLDPQWRHLIATVRICSPQNGHALLVCSGVIVAEGGGAMDTAPSVVGQAVPHFPQKADPVSIEVPHWVQFIVRPFIGLNKDFYLKTDWNGF
jgi:hypothetical protein